MASNKRTIHLGLDYSDFTGGVTEVNRKMSLLDAEFKRATQEAKNYGTETDQLALKEDYLTQKIALQNQKVEEAKKAYDAVMSSQNASAKEIDELDKRLLNERTKLEQLRGELIKTQQETLGLDEVNKKLNDTLKGLAVGVGAALAALTKFALDTANTADELKTLSSQTGFTVEEIQKLQYAAKFVDVEFSTLESSITKFERSMAKANDGSKDMMEIFRKLQIRIKDNAGNMRNANDVFMETIDKLGNVRNETELDIIAMELFGKSAKELKPLIEQGSDALKKYGDEAERHSLIMSEDEVNAASEFKDSMDRLNAVVDRLKQLLGEALMPILEGIAEFLSEVDIKTLMVIGAVGGIIALIYKLVTAISAVTTVMAAQTGIQTVFNAVSLKTIAVILAIVAAIALLVYLISKLTGESEKAKSEMKEIEGSTANIAKNINSATMSTNSVQNHARGTDYYNGQKTWVGEEGPELVELPTGSKIHSANESAKMMGSVNNYYITIDAKNVQDFNHVIALAQQLPMAQRRV